MGLLAGYYGQTFDTQQYQAAQLTLNITVDLVRQDVNISCQPLGVCSDISVLIDVNIDSNLSSIIKHISITL